jgi:hypothetical protein
MGVSTMRKIRGTAFVALMLQGGREPDRIAVGWEVIGANMQRPATLFARILGAVLAALLGTAFFFTIIGVFGLTPAILALVLFIALAAAIFRCPQAEGSG